MAKSENQKLKLLYLAKILSEDSCLEHPVPMAKLISRLAAEGISAERKSLYSDIEYLKSFGFDIEYNPEKKNGGYYLASRDFELAELKILVDMVQASRFLSEKKSKELIRKLETLTDRYGACELQRNVFVTGRPKTCNEAVYYSIDAIHKAISSNSGIFFQYQQYNVGKSLTYRRGGKIYAASPYYLVWNNENYYLIAVDESNGEIRHYRVDRMKNISLTDTERKFPQLFEHFDLSEYTNSAFGMFGGKSRRVRLICENSLAGVVIDRFGDRLSIRKVDENHFSVTPEVVTSGQFFGWLAGIGTGIRIDSPAEIKESYHEYLRSILENDC